VAIHVDRVVSVRPFGTSLTAVELVDGQTVQVERPWEDVVNVIAAHPYWSTPQRVTYVEEPKEPSGPNPWVPLLVEIIEHGGIWLTSTPKGLALLRHIEERAKAAGLMFTVESPATAPRDTQEDPDTTGEGLG
jgi:hypothetical protein